MKHTLGLRILCSSLAGLMTLSMVACSKPVDGGSGTSSSMGSEIDDSAITTQVKAALLKEPSIKSLDISVTTNKGEVQLSGVVDNASQIERAVAVAKGVNGVTQVTNGLSIKEQRSPA